MKFNQGHLDLQLVVLADDGRVKVYYDIYSNYDILPLSPSDVPLSARWLPNGKIEVVLKIHGGRRMVYYSGISEQPEYGPVIWDNQR